MNSTQRFAAPGSSVAGQMCQTILRKDGGYGKIAAADP